MELSELSVRKFSDLLGSDAPAPGGGSAAAIHGALGAALDAMVCSLTVGRKKYAENEAFAAEMFQKATALKNRFLAAMETDTAVFSAFSATLSLPKNTEEEKAARIAAMQEALVHCTESPLNIMELAFEALELTKLLIGKTNPTASSDVGVAALSLRASIQSAWLNVVINLNSLHDQILIEHFRQKGISLLEKALPLADDIYETILSSL